MTFLIAIMNSWSILPVFYDLNAVPRLVIFNMGINRTVTELEKMISPGSL